MLTEIEKWQEMSGNGPVILMCSDGLGRSGALATILHCIERMKSEHTIDVSYAIKMMRIQRPHAVKYMVSIYNL